MSSLNSHISKICCCCSCLRSFFCTAIVPEFCIVYNILYQKFGKLNLLLLMYRKFQNIKMLFIYFFYFQEKEKESQKYHIRISIFSKCTITIRSFTTLPVGPLELKKIAKQSLFFSFLQKWPQNKTKQHPFFITLVFFDLYGSITQ